MHIPLVTLPLLLLSTQSSSKESTTIDSVANNLFSKVFKTTVSASEALSAFWKEELGKMKANPSYTPLELTEASGNTRMCSCADVSAYYEKSPVQMNGCMKTCDVHLKVYGNNTESYLQCFSENLGAISEAESCLFNKDVCSPAGEVKFVKQQDWNELTNITYSSTADPIIKNNILWKINEKKYDNFQRFFHCTKQCIHKQIYQHSAAKGCAIRMPEPVKFAAKMRDCTKHNYKISQSIFATCNCLAWRKGVVDLRTACAIISNQFFIDRA